MKTEDSTVDLNRQLDAYAAVARVPERNFRSRWAKWPVYAAATGAALAGASAASADIVYSGPIDLKASNGATGFSFLEGGVGHGIGAQDSFRFRYHINTNTTNGKRYLGYNILRQFAAVGAGGPDGVFRSQAGYFAKSFAPGAPISGTNPGRSGHLAIPGQFNTRGGQTFKTFTAHGSPVPQRDFSGAELYPWQGGFVGFEIFGLNGSPEPGWFRLTFDLGFPGSVEITGWAYNTDGPINAGQTSATPEPGYFPLMLLAAGAGGVLAWKRHRSTGVPEPIGCDADATGHPAESDLT